MIQVAFVKILEVLEEPTQNEKTGFNYGLYKLLLKSDTCESYTAYVTVTNYEVLTRRIALLEKGVSEEDLAAFESAVVDDTTESNLTNCGY